MASRIGSSSCPDGVTSGPIALPPLRLAVPRQPERSHALIPWTTAQSRTTVYRIHFKPTRARRGRAASPTPRPYAIRLPPLPFLRHSSHP